MATPAKPPPKPAPPVPGKRVSDHVATVVHVAIRPVAFAAKTAGGLLGWLGSEVQALGRKL